MLEYDRIDISERIGCHDLLHKAMNFNDAAIVSIKGSDYRIHFWNMSKDDAINIMKNSNHMKKWITVNFFIIYKNVCGNSLSKKQGNSTK